MGQSNPVGDTQLAVPIESSRMASLSDSYIEWCSPFFDSRDPVNITTCINNGIPMRTCCAVDSAIHDFLSRISSRNSEAEVCRGSVPNQEPVSSHISADATLMQLRNNGYTTGNGGTAIAVLREFSQLSDTWKRAASKNQNSAFSRHTLYGETCENHGTVSSLTRTRALRSQSNNNIECNAQAQSALLDTGADISLFQTQAESAMSDKRLSATRI